MNDFITISCPSCGGQLKRGVNTTTYTCDYCGQQHRLRVEDIEEFGRCPVCHRNDRVEIVRAIYNKGGNLASRLAPPANPSKSLAYSPPARPAATQEPTQSNIKSKARITTYLLFILSIILFTSSFCVFSVQENAANQNSWKIIMSSGAIFFLAGIFFLIKVVIEEVKVNELQDRQLLAEWEKQTQDEETQWSAYKKKYDDNYRQKSAQLTKKHKKAVQRYDQLYYCHRDDCVFIPGESGHAPSAKIEEFLYQESKSISQ